MVDELRCICPWMEGPDHECPHHGECASWGHPRLPTLPHECACGVRQAPPILVRKGPEGHWWVFRRGAEVGHPWRFWLNAIWSARSERPVVWAVPLPESLVAL